MIEVYDVFYLMPTCSRGTWENERSLFSLESTRHPNIVHFIASDSSESGGVVNSSPLQLYLVTHYYPLGSLEGYLRARMLTWQQACEVVRSVACGLKHLHADTCETQGSGISTEKHPIAHRWAWLWGVWSVGRARVVDGVCDKIWHRYHAHIWRHLSIWTPHNQGETPFFSTY